VFRPFLKEEIVLSRVEHKAVGWKRAVVVFVSLCFLAVPLLWAETPPAEVLHAATDGLGSYLNSIPVGGLDYFGFTSRDEFALATVGTPFRVYTLSPAAILSYEEGDDISAHAVPTNLWIFPVVCDGQARTVLTVDLMEEGWRAVNLGESYLAPEMVSMRDYLSQFDGYEARFVRVYQAARSDFILLTSEEVSWLVPLRSAALVLGLVRKGEPYQHTMMSSSEVMPRLAPVVRASLGVPEE
jgi:hypothetical protein